MSENPYAPSPGDAVASLQDPVPTYTVKPPENEPPRLGTIERLTSIFLSPGEVFEDVNRKPGWAVPLIAFTVLMLGFSMLITWQLKLDPREIAQAAIEKNLAAKGKRMSDFSPQERQAIENQIEVSVKIQKYVPYVIPLVGVPIACTFFASLYMLGTLLIRGQTTFVKVFTVTIYASFAVDTVKALLTSFILVLKRPTVEDILSNNLTMSHLGILAPQSAPAWVKTWLQQFDFFTIWFIFLIAFGLAAVCYKKKTAQVIWIPLGLWLIWMVIRVGFSMLTGT